MRFRNKSNQPQEINLINGQAITVYPGKVETVNSNDLYSEEKNRITPFFEVLKEEEKENNKFFKNKSSNKNNDTQLEIDGGDTE